MKIILLISIISISIMSCKSKEINLETLPKDIALKKTLNENYPTDSANLKNLQLEIVNSIAEKTCLDASHWKIAPMGSKPCGGPVSFIAYPKELEEELLPKIKTYSIQESGFNEKYGIVSNCVVEIEPAGIACENGKAVFVD